MTWIAITTEPRKQRLARKRLRRKGYDAYLPCIVVKRPMKIWRKRQVVQVMPYIFVRIPHQSMTELMLHDILSTRDVRSYIGSKVYGPQIVKDGEIAALKTAISGMVLDAEAARYAANVSLGERARIKAGTLAGKVGTVTWVKNQRARLEAFIFGAVRVVEVKAEDLEAA